MKPLLHSLTSLDGSDLDRIDARTVAERYNNAAVADVIGHTQVWQWPGGDAIAMVCNRLGEPSRTAVVIRVGDEVRTIVDPQWGLQTAMHTMGLDPGAYAIR